MLDSIIYIVVRPYKLYYTAALFLAYEVERYILTFEPPGYYRVGLYVQLEGNSIETVNRTAYWPTVAACGLYLEALVNCK